MRVRVDKEKENSISLIDICPNILQQIVFRVCKAVKKEFDKYFTFEDADQPYVFSICCGYTPDSPYISWGTETIQEHQREIGNWSNYSREVMMIIEIVFMKIG